jgi:class 3 adenylate cyclase
MTEVNRPQLIIKHTLNSIASKARAEHSLLAPANTRTTLLAMLTASALAIGIFALDTLSSVEFAVAVLYVVVVLIAATYLGRRSVLIAAMGCAALTIISFVLMHHLKVSSSAILRAAMSLAAIGITTLLALRNLMVNETLGATQRQRANLARFFSPQLVDELAEIDTPLSLTRHQPAAVLFVDMVGFTAYCAKAEPDDVIRFLRDLQALLSKCVFSHNGTIDKFLGDGLLAVFGPPLPSSVDATNAAHCALEILCSVQSWNLRRREKGDEPIRIVIGVHYGPIVQGDIGSENRLELTIVGDTVNVASRVEGYCRTVDFNFLVTAAFIDALHVEGSDNLARMFTDLGHHVLRGRAEPTHLFGIDRVLKPF